jgi:hypothetical protein
MEMLQNVSKRGRRADVTVGQCFFEEDKTKLWYEELLNSAGV